MFRLTYPYNNPHDSNKWVTSLFSDTRLSRNNLDNRNARCRETHLHGNGCGYCRGSRCICSRGFDRCGGPSVEWALHTYLPLDYFKERNKMAVVRERVQLTLCRPCLHGHLWLRPLPDTRDLWYVISKGTIRTFRWFQRGGRWVMLK